MSDGSGGAPQLDERIARKLFEWDFRRPDDWQVIPDDLRERYRKKGCELAALAASSGAGELDLTDEEIEALLNGHHGSGCGYGGEEVGYAFTCRCGLTEARAKLRARLDRKGRR